MFAFNEKKGKDLTDAAKELMESITKKKNN